MKLRRISKITTFVTIATFLVCFGASIWFVHTSAYKRINTDKTPILRSVSNAGAATVTYRRSNAENSSIQPIITIANYFVATINNEKFLFAYVDNKTALSPWLLCGNIAIPTRADPNLLIA